MEKITLSNGSELRFGNRIKLHKKDGKIIDLGVLTPDGVYSKKEKEGAELQKPILAWTVHEAIYKKAKIIRYKTESYTYTISTDVKRISQPLRGEMKVVIPVSEFNKTKNA